MARILVIEDDSTHRRIIREILNAYSHDVTDAEDGDMGIRLQQDHGFDLIVTDILMPGKEGIETVRELVRLYPDVRILAISACKEGYLEAARKFGAMETLAKPFEPEELAGCVDDCLQRKPGSA
ncbi:MAG: response regulator [Rhodospirillaceae bacterium]|nr:response regulator [Rhodospirillaceae bacterium]MBT6429817.1 response regulator [Rhodospirillaceae bacterium]